MAGSAIAAALRQAHKVRTMVDVGQRFDEERCFGYLLGQRGELIALARIEEGGTYDGVMWLRVADLTVVEPTLHPTYWRAALKLKRQRLPRDPAPAARTFAGVLLVAARTGAVVTLHQEELFPEEELGRRP